MNLSDRPLDLDQQLEGLAAHRAQRVVPMTTRVEPAPTSSLGSRAPVLAAVAAAFLLFATGAFLLLRAGADNATVDAAGGSTIDARPEAGTGGVGPATSTPFDSSDPDRRSLFSELFDRPDSDDAADGDDGPPVDEGPSTSEPTATDASDGDPEVSDAQVDEAPPEVDQAGAALAEVSATVIDLTGNLAESGADAVAGPVPSTDDRGRRQTLAGDLATGAAGREGCATSTVEADLSISIRFDGCLNEDGRPVHGVLTAWVDRWVPLQIRLVTAGLEIGDDRLWMRTTLSFAATDPDRIEPALSGEILVESGGDVTYLEGELRFPPGQAVLDGRLSYVTDTALVGVDAVSYRPGQTIVVATSAGVVIREGSCAPSGGTTEYRVYRVTGIADGGAETTDLALVELELRSAADVIYRSTTPVDGRVDLRLGDHVIDHRLQEPCR